MIKRACLIAGASLALLFVVDLECLAQGFGGFHRRGRNVVVRPGWGYYRAPRFGYGVGYGYVGNPYAAVGGTTYIGGVRVGGPPPVVQSLGPAPGPVGVDKIGTKDTRTNLRSYNQSALSESLGRSLPSDAGLPPIQPGVGGGKN